MLVNIRFSSANAWNTYWVPAHVVEALVFGGPPGTLHPGTALARLMGHEKNAYDPTLRLHQVHDLVHRLYSCGGDPGGLRGS